MLSEASALTLSLDCSIIFSTASGFFLYYISFCRIGERVRIRDWASISLNSLIFLPLMMAFTSSIDTFSNALYRLIRLLTYTLLGSLYNSFVESVLAFMIFSLIVLSSSLRLIRD